MIKEIINMITNSKLDVFATFIIPIIITLLSIFQEKILRILRNRRQIKISRRKYRMRNEVYKHFLAIIYDERTKILKHKKEMDNVTKILKKTNKNLDKYQNSIVDDIYRKKKRKMNYALIVEFVGIAFYFCINIILNTDIKFEILFFLYGSFMLILLLKVLVSYRIKKGYYGMNYGECKELMKYLLNDVDKNDIDKGKKVFNDTNDYEKVKEKDPAIVGEPQY